MAVYTASKSTKVLTIHKLGCRYIPNDKLKPCGCGDTGMQGDQRWYCEDHVTLDDVEKHMNHKFWAVLLCDICFRDH